MAGVVQRLDLGELVDALREAVPAVAEWTLEEPLRLLAVYLGSETKRNFDEGRSPNGEPWLPVRRRRRRNETATKPLRDTGILMAAASAFAAPGSIREVGPTFLVYGAAVDYGGYHQHGTRTIPQRQWLGITEAMADRMADIVADWIERKLAG